MHVLNIENKKYFVQIDIELVSPHCELGRINLTPRWKCIAKNIKDNFIGVNDCCELMFIEVTDYFFNKYGQESHIFRLTYGGKLESNNCVK